MLTTVSRLSNLQRALCATLLIALCAAATRAQIGGIDSDPGDAGTGGRNTIRGQIFYPGGRKVDRRLRVRISSIATGEQSKLTDDNGTFTFYRLRGGTYYLTIEVSSEFEPANETVNIIEPAVRSRIPKSSTYAVTFNLQLKKSNSRSIGTVDAAAANVPEAAMKLYKQAIESSQTGDSKKAVEQLNQALAIHPNFLLALNELGVQYMKLNQFDKAVDVLRSAVKIAPEAFHPRLNYGIVLVNLKNYKDAASELQIAVQKDSSSATAHFYFGRALVSLGSYDAAEKALRQTISIGGEEATEAHRYLGAVYIEKRESLRAADELEQYLKLAPRAKDADRIRAIIKDLRSQASAKRQ